jgi:2-succinyl-5-enolpyruvyl-6-hydroxy-3-cyclohexene-1-carboxylate synthase
VLRAPARALAREDAGRLRELVARSRRGLVVAGRHERGPSRSDLRAFAEATAAFCSQAGWPLLADPLSGARRGEGAIAHYDALLREPTFAASVGPDLVLRVGDLPVSKPLRGWLASLGGARQVALDPEAAWQDPASVLSDSLALDPAPALSGLSGVAPPGEEGWLASWRSADERASEAILRALREGGLSEPAVAAELGVLLPQTATLFVASSMPVRDIETFWPVRGEPPRVLCNRGASGIDGTVSSAFGAAADGLEPVVLLIGDVALAHDIGGLLAAARLGLKVTIVLLDNGGGGIFDFLPVSRAAMTREPEPGPSSDEMTGSGARDERPAPEDIYTRHIATPTGLDFAKAAALYGLSHERVGDVPGFRAALERALAGGRSSIVEVSRGRVENVELHGRVWDAVSRALRPQAGEAVPPA